MSKQITKKPGKEFEKLVKLSCEEQDIDFTRLRDAGWTGEQTQRRFTIKNICDAILFYKGIIVFVEMKTRKKSLRFDDITQLDDLGKKWKPENGVFSGVLCSLGNELSFVTYNNLLALKLNMIKKSLNHSDTDEYGIQIDRYVPPGKRIARLDIKHLMLSLYREYKKPNPFKKRQAELFLMKQEVVAR